MPHDRRTALHAVRHVAALLMALSHALCRLRSGPRRSPKSWTGELDLHVLLRR